jgi:hypothetical protein
MANDEFFWHDGNLTSIELAHTGNYVGRIYCELYPSMQVPHRELWCLEFERVKRTAIYADVHEIEENWWAGSISDGTLFTNGETTTLRLFLAGGFIEIVGRGFIAKKVQSAKPVLTN